jgi:membrane associated rhomboid family serine protease
MTMTTTQQQVLMERRRSPFGVTVIAVIQVASAIAYGAVVLYDRADYGNLLGSLGYFGILGPVLGLGGLPIAFGLLWLKRWAWVLTMLWAGLNLIAGLLSYYNDEPNYIGMALSVVAVYYLNQREVQAAFNVVPQEGWARE